MFAVVACMYWHRGLEPVRLVSTVTSCLKGQGFGWWARPGDGWIIESSTGGREPSLNRSGPGGETGACELCGCSEQKRWCRATVCRMGLSGLIPRLAAV